MKRSISLLAFILSMPLYALADPPIGPGIRELSILGCMLLGFMMVPISLYIKFGTKHKANKKRFHSSLVICLFLCCVIWTSWYHIYQNNAQYSIYAPKSFLSFLLNPHNPKKAVLASGYFIYTIWVLYQSVRAVYNQFKSAF